MKKGIKTIALAMAFGVTASASFQGSNLLIEQWTGKEAQAEAAEGVQLNQTLGQNIEGGVNTGSFTGGTKDISAIASQAMPSVVSITNKSVQEMRLFGQSQAFESESRGTGIIIGQTDTELLLVTNHHVVNGEDEMSVWFFL